ncbi:YajG family lipoprotein [Vibrio metschnikovii]|uniref:YajG family lipoprotein n=1 Tax=Vibrio metschnikovii TaxID=28172 RepID=UPI002FC6D0B9
MKKLVIAASIALLTACAAPKQEQVNFMPQAVLSSSNIVNNISFTLVSKDVRSAQYVALVDSGRNHIEPVHTKQNVRITLENALAEQFASQGFRLTVNSENNLALEIQEALVTVKHSITSHEMNASVTLELTAETPKGKLVKSYNGAAKRSAALSASNQDIERVFNDVVNLVLKEIANDSELQSYMKDRFNG